MKNRLSTSYDAKASAGYRDVLVNFRIVNEELCRIGVETHVCEVQLQILEFAKVKSIQGHSRYVQFRNCRGE